MLDIEKPECATWDQWEEWEAKTKKERPVAYFFRESLPLFFLRSWDRFVHEPWYWMKCRFWYRYNVVRIKTLPPTWCDRDEVLLHAAFQILTDYVEREQPWEFTATPEEIQEAYGGPDECHPSRLQSAAELKSLYHWWTVERLARKEPEDTGRDWGQKLLAAEKQWNEEDDANLKRLIDIRQTLWT